MGLVTLEDVKKCEEVVTFLEIADKQLERLGYTEHSYRHVEIVATAAGEILKTLNYEERNVELAKIAGYLHDIGNAVNRIDHAQSGAILAYNILTKMGMSCYEAGEIMLAIGNHDENTGTAVSPISAALILADKSDVHRTRVRNKDITTFDIHDRVNYAVEHSEIYVDAYKMHAILELEIDTKICPVMDYFEIFLDRMTMNRRAANFLGLEFKLVINGTNLL
ncbi:MAG TPA: HD domain-containing protein [Ruminiclostridium sp.]|jgi:putative nucleotidyltransferase with HDIG domain|uniref:Phosphohydrolase n=1 Tax=Acetivibrio saccincola TaxID=1677857 RepID=A0A2K9E357_9FIRM|nr:HD domain-containing protein [Acetivibrio saccincola]HAA42432.1 HD domain-containing protein [Ruminiclostridium sp.]AUG57799.1 Ribonuclease Y [Acetivibrio saccincola]NLW25831.1 HD domain-containing protein [Acetivibrio saccincola]PQQ67684.1 phosphohydrolase [Acetivibrio saccincola]HQD28053.1 HD domain-containing protein [Acetivibrio saccincola]